MDPEVYDRWYETPRGRWIGTRESALVLAELAPRPGESLLDVGCGTGYFTRALASATTGTVTGADVDPRRVDYARRRRDADLSYEVADARALPHPNRSFDLVVAITALCFVDDERRALCEMLRVARRRVAVGLLNRHSLLGWQRARDGGRGGYRGARWHTVREAARLFDGLLAQQVRVRTAIHLPGGGRFARFVERIWPGSFHTGAFILVVADVARQAALSSTRIESGTAGEAAASRP